MADIYTEDATYGWNVGPNDEFMAVGRDEIREIALGLEMAGLEGWTYPYQKVLIDEQQGEILGLWKQVADATKADGTQLRDRRARGQLVPLRAGTSSGRWQRDFFDVGNAGAVFMDMIGDGTLLPGHAAAHGARHVGRAPARPLPARRGARRSLGGARGGLTQPQASTSWSRFSSTSSGTG